MLVIFSVLKVMKEFSDDANWGIGAALGDGQNSDLPANPPTYLDAGKVEAVEEVPEQVPTQGPGLGVTGAH